MLRSRTSLFRLRDFRLLSLAVLSNSIGMTGEQVALGWLALELTNSPLMVGVALGVRMAPHVLVGIPAGVLADRVDRQRLLQATSGIMALVSAGLGALAMLHLLAIGPLLALTFAAACIRAIHQTVRQSYAHDVAGAGELVTGIALIGLAMRGGGLLGSLASGFLIAWRGAGAAYVAVAIGYLGSVLALAPARARPHEGAPRTGSVRDGFAGLLTAARRDRILPLLFGLTAASEALGFSHQTLFPSLARDVYAVGAEGLGAMTGARSAGGILGILLVSMVAAVPATGAFFLWVLAAFGGALVALALAPSFAWLLLILVVVSAVGALSDILSQSLMQLSVPARLRGRAGGAWVVAIGLGPLGQLEIGGLASLFGTTIALGVQGVALVGVALAAALFSSRLRRL